jgi:hypothetical protein
MEISMNVTPSNHTQALRWLLSELHGGNSFTKDTLWTWLHQVSVVTNGQTTDRNVSVDAAHLRAILDFLHDSEADHYDPETHPEDVNTHVYSHVLAIEADLPTTEKAGVP